MAESRDRLVRVDEEGFSSPFRWGATPMTGWPLLVTPGQLPTASARGSGDRVGRDNARSENFQRRQGRGRGSDLPSWYPRAPLRDITAISRAIERRRDRILREHEENPQIDSPIPPQEQTPLESLLSAQFEQSLSLNSSISKETDDYSTPEPLKKHMNHVDSMAKSMLEDIRKMKSTPSAKKAERVRKIQTLMSMR